VRIAFASNDERTARRISDALGTATEQRAMRNYAGHRLAPWLAHVMVSRQETSRPLLTPGEVMQLNPTDELVLVSGLPPIRANKLKYFEDRNFSCRVLKAPSLSLGRFADRPEARADDWTGRVATAPAFAPPPDLVGGTHGGLQQTHQPGLPDRRPRETPGQVELLGNPDDDRDAAIEAGAMDKLCPLVPAVAAHGLNNEGAGHADLLPSF
jgi:type IV secretion system protein VirD4